MSYCRWSSENFKSDLYVYACVDDTWTIHVAANRVVGDVPPVFWPTDTSDPDQMARCVESHKAQSAYLDNAEHREIELPCAGATFKLPTPGDCADKCEELAALGYVVPAYVVPSLREEQVEMEAENTPGPQVESDKSREEGR